MHASVGISSTVMVPHAGHVMADCSVTCTRFSSWALAQKDVSRAFARDMLRAFIAQSARVDVLQEMLSGSEQDRPHGEMQLVDQRRAQILADGGDAATKAHVAVAGSGPRLFQSGVYAFGDKAEFRVSRHPDRRPRVMRQH